MVKVMLDAVINNTMAKADNELVTEILTDFRDTLNENCTYPELENKIIRVINQKNIKDIHVQTAFTRILCDLAVMKNWLNDLRIIK